MLPTPNLFVVTQDLGWAGHVALALPEMEVVVVRDDMQLDEFLSTHKINDMAYGLVVDAAVSTDVAALIAKTRGVLSMIRIVVVSAAPYWRQVSSALASGASSYLEKSWILTVTREQLLGSLTLDNQE